MKKLTYNLTLLTTVVFLFAFYALALIMVDNNTITASSETTFSRPQTAIEADTEQSDAFERSSFYLHNGASVRVSSSGIKFVTFLDPDFHNELSKNNASVTYFAIAKKVGGAIELASEISYSKNLNENGYYELFTYINFIGIENESQETINEYYANEYTTSTFAKVVSEDKSSTTYYKAYSVENDGEYDIKRSMRAVGNAAYLGWTEDSDYDREEVEKYFTSAIRSNDITAYSLDTGKVIFKMPNYSIGGSTVNAYVGARKYTAVYNKITNTFSIDDCEAKSPNLSIFTDDGSVYSTNMTDAKEIASEDDLVALRARTGDVFDNYVLTSNIECISSLSESTLSFGGIFDGMDNIITFSSNNENDALFDSLTNGAKIKNLNVVATDLGESTAVIANNVKIGADVNVENVVLDVKKIPLGGAPIASQNDGNLTVKNSAIFVRDMSEQENGKNGSKFVWNNLGSIIVDNVHIAFKSTERNEMIERYSSNDLNISGTIYPYRYFGGFFNGLVNKTIALPNDLSQSVYRTIKNVTLLNNSNITDFYKIETGDIILTSDIDLTGKTWIDPSCIDSGDYEFKNTDLTFDGAGHTISNIKIGSTAFNGFFTNLAGNSYVVNTTFENLTLGGTWQGLIGRNYGNSTLFNVIIQSSVKIPKYSGLIFGTTTLPVAVKESAIIYDYTGKIESTSGLLCCTGQNNVETSITLDGVVIASKSTSAPLLSSTFSKYVEIVGIGDGDYVHYKGNNVLELQAMDGYSENLKRSLERVKEYCR